MSHTTGTERRPKDLRQPDGRFGAATPGVRAEPAGIGDLVTAPTRRRRRITPWRVTALVVALLVAGGSYALGRYVLAPKLPPTVRIAVTAVALPAGATLTASDIRIVTIQASAPPAGYLSPAAAVGVIGLVTRQPLPAGTLIGSSMLSPSGALPDSSQALVGLDLKAGQVPAGGLVIGQKVLVVLLPVNPQGIPGNPQPLTSTRVWDLLPPTSSGEVQASVIVPIKDAAMLSGYAARGEVSLVATAAPPAPSTTPKPHQSHKPAKRSSHS